MIKCTYCSNETHRKRKGVPTCKQCDLLIRNVKDTMRAENEQLMAKHQTKVKVMYPSVFHYLWFKFKKAINSIVGTKLLK